MRILFLTQFFQPEPMFKGLPFARALVERGHQVDVLTGVPNYPGGRVYPGYGIRALQRERMGPVEVTRVPLFPSHDASALRRIANYVSFGASATAAMPMMRPPDVVYVYNLVTLGMAARCARQIHGARVVLDLQDLWPESVAASGMMKFGLANRLLGAWCRYEYRAADRLTVLSPGFKRELQNRGVPAGKIDVIYNWCDEVATSHTADELAALKRELRFIRRFNVVFAGTMGKVQALDTVLTAAGELERIRPEVLFTFVGGGVEVERLKARGTGRSNVQFLPKCDAAAAQRILSVADALLVHLKADPLFEITIPSKTQAYLYAGRPILMGVRGDAAQLVRTAGAGVIFEPENAASLVNAVCALASRTDAERGDMGASGRRYYRDHLSFTASIARFESTFRQVLEDGSTRRGL